MPARQAPSAAALWVVVCAFFNAAGWGLSAVHQLNPLGYGAACLIGAAAAWLWWRKGETSFCPRRFWARQQRPFRRLFPLAFLFLATLAFLGGAIHAPSNYDALTYRTTRVLHWLAEGRWHWIHTEFVQLNTRGCGFEWLTAPLIALTHSDRFDFVINVVCFLLLPGRIFSLFTRLGVRGRVAWYWMWLLPTGYCYLLQAGSVGNDLFGALMAFLALEFALRARQSGKVGHVWLSILAAGLMTASKAFNLVVLLPWLAAVWPWLGLLFRCPLGSALALAVGASASLAPTALLNLKHCGDWTGLAAEPAPYLAGGAPALHVAVNAVVLFIQNLVPPVFPFASAWNQLMERLIPSALAANLDRYFEPASAKLQLSEMQMEENAGLGMGLSVLIAAVLLSRLLRQPCGWWPNLAAFLRRQELLIPLCTCAAAGVFMARNGLWATSRYFAVFYPLLIAPLLAGDTSPASLMRGAGWRRAGLGVFLLAGLLLVVSPARPLWPALTVLRTLGAEQSSHRLVKRAWSVYSVYGGRADAFRSARAVLPADANPLGFVGQDDPEAALWRPFGSRRILHVCDADSPERIRLEGIKYVLVSSQFLSESNSSLDAWLTRHEGEVVERLVLEVKVTKGPREWFLIKLR